MNIYQKITNARIDIQNMNLKPTGENKHSNYKYYELGDLLPAVNELCKKYNMYTEFSIRMADGIETAVFKIIDANIPESEIEDIRSFSCPTAEVKLPASQDIQGQGAKITYMRRYMIMIAFEIAESDQVEKIKMAVNNEITDEDLSKIQNAKDLTELTKVCGELKQTYKVSLIDPIYKSRKVELQQDAGETTIKKENN